MFESVDAFQLGLEALLTFLLSECDLNFPEEVLYRFLYLLSALCWVEVSTNCYSSRL